MTDLFARALACHQSGDLDQAEGLYRQLLDRRPDHADALHLLGVLHHQRGHHADAARLITQAITLNDQVADYHGHLGLVVQALGQLEQAASHQRRALDLQPRQFEASFNLALVLVALGRPSEAVVHYAEAVHQQPGSGEAQLNYGAVLQDLGLLAEAMEVHQQAAALMPSDPRPWTNMMLAFISLGRPDLAAKAEAEAVARGASSQPENRALLLAAQANSLRQQGRPREAAEQFYQAIRLDPRSASLLNDFALTLGELGESVDALNLFGGALAIDPELAIAWNNRGNALNNSGQRELALADWTRAVTLDPARPEFWTNIANGHRGREDFAQALKCHRRALLMSPASATIQNNFGHALQGELRFSEAAAYFRRALALNPAYAEAWSNLALASQRLGNMAAAGSMYGYALTLNPDMAAVRFNRGLLRLQRGDLPGGLGDYGWRFMSGQVAGGRQPPVAPWRGEDPSSMRIMVWGEQGVGDTLLFSSMLADLISQARAVVVEIDSRMVSLFQRSFPQAEVRAARISPTGSELVKVADYDRHVPMGSLMRVYRDRLDRFPDRLGWLVADAALTGKWQNRLAALPPGLRIGIGWRSQLRTVERNASYVDLAAFAPLLAMPGLAFVNLQYGAAEDEITAVEARFGVQIHRWADLDLRDDFDGTAALMSGLDLVISPAIAVGELAASLGVPVWRFGHDDWTCLGSSVRPFYPAQRPFLVGNGQGLSDVLADLCHHLRGLCPAVPPSGSTVDWSVRLAPLIAGPRVGIHWNGSLRDSVQWAGLFGQSGLCLIALRGAEGDAERIGAEAVYDCTIHRWVDADTDDDLLGVLDLVVSDDPVFCRRLTDQNIPVLLLETEIGVAEISDMLGHLLASSHCGKAS